MSVADGVSQSLLENTGQKGKGLLASPSPFKLQCVDGRGSVDDGHIERLHLTLRASHFSSNINISTHVQTNIYIDKLQGKISEMVMFERQDTKSVRERQASIYCCAADPAQRRETDRH